MFEVPLADQALEAAQAALCQSKFLSKVLIPQNNTPLMPSVGQLFCIQALDQESQNKTTSAAAAAKGDVRGEGQLGEDQA